MKKILVVSSIIIVLGGLAAAGYWYWQSQPEVVVPLQTVALDNPGITSFDDVCTAKDEYELTCTGNIEQFGCGRYRSTMTTFTDLNPSYPMLTCEKKMGVRDALQAEKGVYRVPGIGWTALTTTIVDYIVIKDNSYQFVQSEDQFRQLYQPIDNVVEATGYFEALHQAVLVTTDRQLSSIKSPKKVGGDVKGVFHVPLDSIDLSEIIKTWRGYTITAYSGLGGDCVDEIYQYQYLLKEDGHLIEKNKKLIWEVANKPACIY